MRRLTLILGIVALAGFVAAEVEAKPRRAAQRKVSKNSKRQKLRLREIRLNDPEPARAKLVGDSDRFIVGAFVSQAHVASNPSAVGLSAQGRLPFRGRLGLGAGFELGLHRHRTHVQTHAGVDYQFLQFGQFQSHAGVGLALPMQKMTDTLAVALALRGAFGMRWLVHDQFMPYGEVAVLTGSMVSPGNVSPGAYAALQLSLGVAIGL